MSNNDLQKRNPIRNMQMALNTACAMGTAAMMSTMFAYADVTSAINKVFISVLLSSCTSWSVCF